MVYSEKDFDFSKMSVPERIQLVQDLWDSVHDDVQAVGLTDDQRQEMRRRLKELDPAKSAEFLGKNCKSRSPPNDRRDRRLSPGGCRRHQESCRRWYCDIAPELALAFDASLAATVSHIERFPKMYAEVELGIRRVTLSRFPYQLFYHPGAATSVHVLGFYHSHTDPESTTAKIASRGRQPEH